MNQIKTLLLLLALMPTWACAINRPTSIFMFGFCTSFNDSTVYLTDIQQVDSAWIDTKTDFLYSRDNYSFQLRDYMKEAGVEQPTCVVIFAEKRKNAEKKFLKLRKRYTRKGTWTMKNIDQNSFSFQHITPDTPEATYTKEQLREAIKKEKAEMKAAKKQAKTAAKTKAREKKIERQKAMEDARQRAKELKQSRQS